MVLSGGRMTKKSILGAAPGSGSKSASMIRECKSCKSEDSEWDPNQHVAIWTTLRAVWIALFEAHLKATFTNHFKPMSSPNPGQIFQTHGKTTGLGINPEDPEVGAPDTQTCSLSARRCCSSSRSRWISWVSWKRNEQEWCRRPQATSLTSWEWFIHKKSNEYLLYL